MATPAQEEHPAEKVLAMHGSVAGCAVARPANTNGIIIKRSCMVAYARVSGEAVNREAGPQVVHEAKNKSLSSSPGGNPAGSKEANLPKGATQQLVRRMLYKKAGYGAASAVCIMSRELQASTFKLPKTTKTTQPGLFCLCGCCS